MVELNYVKVKYFVYMYMLLPLLCFIALYLHFWLGGIFLVALYVLSIVKIRVSVKRMKRVRRRKKVLRIHVEVPKSNYILQIPIRYLVIFAIVAVIWSFLGGQGNLYYQSGDWDIRNAIYRDIIYREWPVIYPDYDKALVYYIGYWLPAASITKVVGAIVPKIYMTEQAFAIGNIFLWIWTSIGIFLVELLLLTYAKPQKRRRVMLVPIFIVFFSGMDILGVIRDVIVRGQQFQGLHIEWWSTGLQFSSLTTCLFWVFNQTIVPWLAILCVLQEEKLQNYVFIGICTLAAGPIPMVGIAVYMLCSGIYKGINSIVNKELKAFIIEVMSPVNCLSIFILPIFLLYYKSNQAISNGIGTGSTIFSMFEIVTITGNFFIEILLFIMLEAGIYLLFLYRTYKEDIFYYITIITAMIAPIVKLRGADDFVTRFSIPTVMVLAAMCLKYLANYGMQKINDRLNKYVCISMCVCLLIGAATPMTEFFRGYNAILQEGKIANVYDNVKTFDQDIPANFFTVHDYKNSAFFKYLMPKE